MSGLGDATPEAVQRTPALFLSYSAEDEAQAQQLHEILLEKGYQVWRAPDSIHGGRPWAEQIV